MPPPGYGMRAAVYGRLQRAFGDGREF